MAAILMFPNNRNCFHKKRTYFPRERNYFLFGNRDDKKRSILTKFRRKVSFRPPGDILSLFGDIKRLIYFGFGLNQLGHGLKSMKTLSVEGIAILRQRQKQTNFLNRLALINKDRILLRGLNKIFLRKSMKVYSVTWNSSIVINFYIFHAFYYSYQKCLRALYYNYQKPSRVWRPNEHGQLKKLEQQEPFQVQSS